MHLGIKKEQVLFVLHSIYTIFAEIYATYTRHEKENMKQTISRLWKPAVALLFGLAIFLTCLFPLRAVLHLHEQQHLFRWTGSYLRELATTADGWVELAVSFVTQFFYIGWLGAAVVALLAMGVQALTWWLMRRCRLRSGWWFPLSLVPAALLFYFVFIPREFLKDELYREAAEYDYLVRAQRWDAILWKSYRQTPLTTNGTWCTNYALAKKGRLLQQMFEFYQNDPNGLLMDAARNNALSLYSLSDIMLDLGMVNNAQRMAFDAAVQLPRYHKSGRLYQRLALTNMVNGHEKVARKYLHFLESTLFYGRWAKNMLAGQTDEQMERLKQLRTTTDTQLSYSIDHALHQLVSDHPENQMARDYLLAYEMLRLDLDKVLEYALDERGRMKDEGGWSLPKSVQECIIGHWLLTRTEGDSLPMPIEKSIYETTLQFMQIVNSTGNMQHPELSQPPFNHSYWSYHVRAKSQLSQKP